MENIFQIYVIPFTLITIYVCRHLYYHNIYRMIVTLCIYFNVLNIYTEHIIITGLSIMSVSLYIIYTLYYIIQKFNL